MTGQQDNNRDPRLAEHETIHQPQLVNESRRRFGKSGLAATGVLATLASRPVLGCEVCKSPSGFLSGNLSKKNNKPVTCAGRSPGYWKNKTSWPISNRSTAKFSSVFTCSPSSPYKSVTMLTLLSHQSYDTNNLGMHLVATYLNVVQGWSSFLTVERLNTMFTEIQTKGYFSPTAGVKWTAAQVVDYLKKTMD